MDGDILEELYQKYYGAALAYCISLCSDENLAQDFVADAFVKAYLSLPNDVPSFRYWLMRVCKNMWIDHIRRQKHIISNEAVEYLTDEMTPELQFMRKEKMKDLWKIVKELSAADREWITLYYFSGVSMQEIAVMSGKSHTAVRQKMTRLRKVLKQRMEEMGHEF